MASTSITAKLALTTEAVHATMATTRRRLVRLSTYWRSRSTIADFSHSNGPLNDQPAGSAVSSVDSTST
nr:hypothetical protein [Mycobacterium ulcerans]